MLIWYYNKETNEGRIFGSRKAACNHTGVKVNSLYYHLNQNRGAKLEYTEGNHYFRLEQIIRSKRKK